MPKIPEYGNRVSPGAGAGVPNIGQSADVGGLSRVTQGLVETVSDAATGLLREQAKIEEEQRQAAEDTKFMDIEARMIQQRMNDFQDPENGLYSPMYLGKESLKAPEDFKIRASEHYARLEEGVYGEAEKARFARLRANDQLKRNAEISRHVSNQRREYEGQTQQAFIQAKSQEIFANPMDTAGNIAEIKDAANQLGRMKGLSGDALKGATKEIVSNAHMIAIRSFIQNEDGGGAEQYYQRHVKSLVPNDAIKAKSLVKKQSLINRVHEESDRIMALGMTYEETIAEGRKHEGEMRDALVSRLENRLRGRKIAHEHRKDEAWMAFEDFSRNNPGKEVPLNIMEELTEGQRKAIDRLRADPLKKKTNVRAWIKFNQLSAEQMKGLSLPDFMEKYFSKFDTSDGKKAREMYLSALKDAPEFGYNNLKKSLIRDAVVRVGLATDYKKMEKDNPQLLLKITNAVDEEMLNQQNALNKKNLSKDEVNTIINGIVDDVVYDHGGVFGFGKIVHGLDIDFEDDEDVVIKRENVSEIDQLSWSAFAQAMGIDSRDSDEEERFYYMLYKARKLERERRR